MLVASLQELLSTATYLKIFCSLKSIFADSSQVRFGLPLRLFTLSIHFRTLLLTGASWGLHWIYPNHLSQSWVNFSSIGATASFSQISVFYTLSLLVWPQNHRNIHIYATLSCWICCLLVVQHSSLYNITSWIIILLNFLLAFMAPSCHRGRQKKLDTISTSQLRLCA